MSRIGIRMLLMQHVALHHPKEGFVGTIGSGARKSFVLFFHVSVCRWVGVNERTSFCDNGASSMVWHLCADVSPREVAEAAISDCRRLCESSYGIAPDVSVLPPPPSARMQ